MSNPSDRGVLVSYLPLAGAGDEEYARLHARLPPDEQARAERHRLPQDRLAFAAGRALARALLSQLVPAPSIGWTFDLGPHGKPQLEPRIGLDLEFSISHSAEMVAVAAAAGRLVGVDVESTASDIPYLDIAQARFASSEQILLASLSEDSRRDGFFSLWTLHEAYAKARGDGLSDKPSPVAFSLDPLTITFMQDSDEQPLHWAFRLLDLPAAHRLAVGVSKQTAEEVVFSVSPADLSALL